VEWLRRLAEEGAEATPEETANLPEELTIEEAAAVAKRAPSTVRGWAPQIEGAYKVHGRDWRIPRASLLSFMRSGASEAEPDIEPPSEANLGDWRQHYRGAA